MLETSNHVFSSINSEDNNTNTCNIKINFTDDLFLLERKQFYAGDYGACVVATQLTKYDSNIKKIGFYEFDLKKMAAMSSVAAVDNSGNVYILAVSSRSDLCMDYLINTIVKIPAAEIK